MTLLLKQIFQLFKLLNSDQGTNQIAWGLALGCVLGFSPFLSLQTFLVLFISFFFRVQLGAAFLSAFFFKVIAYLIDPLADHLGNWVLNLQGLNGLFVTLYNMPLVPMTRFNNTLVMGSGVIGFILSIPLFFIFKKLIQQYRQIVVQRYQSSKIWKLWTSTTIYKFYTKYEELYG